MLTGSFEIGVRRLVAEFGQGVEVSGQVVIDLEAL
jgi:hypothetical protein